MTLSLSESKGTMPHCLPPLTCRQPHPEKPML